MTLNKNEVDERGKCDRPSKKTMVRHHLRFNWLKYILGIFILLSVGEFAYIYHLDMGLRRVPNDPFDLWFGNDINRKTPEIWDDKRQEFLRKALPVPIHSHNDYERRVPLFEALGSGCISVEADIHLHDSDLLVGHSSKGLSDDKTLQSLYVEPLQRMLKEQNSPGEPLRGLFDQAPDQTLVLLVDFKTSGPETFAELDAQLQPLRDLDYLTYWNGTARVSRPLTIVASGNAPFESVRGMNATHRDIFWDAKLERLISIEDNFETEPPTFKYNRSNSYFASTKFQNAILFKSQDYPESFLKTPQGKDMASTQIEQAKSRGLLTRYWNTPSEPPNLRDIAWRVLVDHKVGVLNMDDLGTVRARAKGWGELKRDSL